MDSEIEFVARALHAAENEDFAWEREHDLIKDEFRAYACAALKMLAQHRADEPPSAERTAFPYAA